MYFAGQLLRLGRVRELSAESLEYLGDVVRDTGEDTKHRVAAARCLVAHSEWREDRESPPLRRQFLEMFKSPEEAAAWLKENGAGLIKQLEDGNGRGRDEE